jgi:hypothetical protein
MRNHVCEIMYVRYLGPKVCWTVDDGRFYIGDRDELTDAERLVCEQGGGDLPLSVGVDGMAS